MNLIEFIFQLKPAEIIAATGVISTAGFGYAYYRGAGRRATYDYIESQINKILEIQISRPHLREEGIYERLRVSPGASKPLPLLEYEAYSCLVWNTLETIFHKYGKRKIKRSPFLPAMQSLARRHRTWLIDAGNLSVYDLKMIAFLIEHRTI